MSKPKLLVVDDEESIRTQMKWALNKDYEVYMATEPSEAMMIAKKERPSLVTLDLGLPPNPEDTSEGLKLLDDILSLDSATKVVVVTGSPEREAALNAISQGAHDFFTKPIDIDELKAILKRASYVHTLEVEKRELQRQVGKEPFGGIIGSSDVMHKVYETTEKVATTDAPVLITGESGTGKELVAKAIHDRSLRNKKPFVPINCGAIPENLMESELFGHEKGSFTGAHAQRPGKIEAAAGGTLFLDEIGELPLNLQVKILRFLQDHSIERVGGRKPMEIDVRVVAATNKNLESLVSEGAFRDDLFYRLAVVTIELPPLRERGDDVIIIAKSFLQKFSDKGAKQREFSREANMFLESHDWPGNVRELENRIRRATTLASGPSITPDDLGFASALNLSGETLDLKKAREETDKKYISMALTKHKGNISKAADELGFSRPAIHALLKKYGLEADSG